MRSTEALTEPFWTVLIEFNLPGKREVMEYTLLLDPPVYSPDRQATASPSAPDRNTGNERQSGSKANAAPIASEQSSSGARAPGLPSTGKPGRAASAALLDSQDLPATGPQPWVLDEGGKRVPLYTASYALLISESKYPGGESRWRPLSHTAEEMDSQCRCVSHRSRVRCLVGRTSGG
jgi:hypothetical protein